MNESLGVGTLVMVSARCTRCSAVVAVSGVLPSHGDVRAHALVCGHVHLRDSQHNVGAVSAAQWEAALWEVVYFQMIDTNGNRSPSFPTLCAQFDATRVPVSAML